MQVCKFGNGEHVGSEITNTFATNNERPKENHTVIITEPLIQSNQTKAKNDDDAQSEEDGGDDDSDDADDDDDDEEEEEEDENDEDEDDDNDADDNSDKIDKKETTEDKKEENKVQDESDNLPKQRNKRQSASESDEAFMNYYSIGIQRSAQFVVIQNDSEDSDRNVSYEATITYTGVRWDANS